MNAKSTTPAPRPLITEEDIDRWLAGAPLHPTGREDEGKKDEQKAA